MLSSRYTSQRVGVLATGWGFPWRSLTPVDRCTLVSGLGRAGTIVLQKFVRLLFTNISVFNETICAYYYQMFQQRHIKVKTSLTLLLNFYNFFLSLIGVINRSIPHLPTHVPTYLGSYLLTYLPIYLPTLIHTHSSIEI
jgi:hypothetical protein